MQVAFVACLEIGLVPTLPFQAELRRGQLFLQRRITAVRAMDQRVVAHLLQDIEAVLATFAYVTVDRHVYSLDKAADSTLRSVLEVQSIMIDANFNDVTGFELALQDLLRKWILDLLLDRAS